MKALLLLVSFLTRLWDRLDQRLCRSLPGPIRFRWAKLWVRKDEFHPSLDSHAEYVYRLPVRVRDNYWHNLIERRQIAHERDLSIN